MSIRPIAFDDSTQTYTMQHDEEGHTFDIALSELSHIDYTVDGHNWKFIVVTCPTDGWSSTHPVSGGAAPLEVQAMAAKVVETKNCPCGTLADTTPEIALAHSKLHCAQMDGLDRWRVEANSGPAVNVLINAETDYVCGLGPVNPAELPATYTTESTLTRAGVDILDIVTKNIYTKRVNGKIVKAERPTHE